MNDKTSAIEYLNINSVREYSPEKICNHLGNYFSGVGKQFAKRINQSDKPISYYISKIAKNQKSLMLPPVSDYEVEKIINKLAPKKQCWV